MSEDDARLERPIRAGNDRLPSQHHEPSHVARVVLDPSLQDLQAVQVGGASRGNRSGVAEVVGGDEFGGAGGVVDGFARDVEAEFGQSQLTLSQSLRMRDDSVQVLFSDPWEGQEAVVDWELDLADDVETVAEEKIVISVN